MLMSVTDLVHTISLNKKLLRCAIVKGQADLHQLVTISEQSVMETTNCHDLMTTPQI